MGMMTGGCLCGGVRYETGEPVMTGVCHCRDCQKQTGTSFSIIAVLPEGDFTLHGQPSQFVTVGESGGRVWRHFCGHCGSPIYSIVESMPGVVCIKAGTLDDPSVLAPQAEFWCDTAQPWLATRTSLPRIARNPPAG
jgi:hypothetical protein